MYITISAKGRYACRNSHKKITILWQIKHEISPRKVGHFHLDYLYSNLIRFARFKPSRHLGFQVWRLKYQNVRATWSMCVVLTHRTVMTAICYNHSMALFHTDTRRLTYLIYHICQYKAITKLV